MATPHSDPDAVTASPADARLQALAQVGLAARPDGALDRFADLASKIFHVPMALVSLVEADRQIFPGAWGLAEPWNTDRQAPLSHSLWQQVVLSDEPLVVIDARTDARVAGNLAIDELGIVGYLGFPLSDGDGNVLGSLCAIDTAPRTWTATEVSLMEGLAAACSSELRLRIVTSVAARALRQSRVDQRQLIEAEAAASAIGRDVQDALANGRLLLEASQALTATTTAEDILDVVGRLVSGAIKPAHVHVALRVDRTDRVQVLGVGDIPAAVAAEWETFRLDSEALSGHAIRTGRAEFLATREQIVGLLPGLGTVLQELGWHALATAPLVDLSGLPFGALTMSWRDEHTFSPPERAVITALAGYVAQAFVRAQRLAERVNAAYTLQESMLTAMPHIAGLQFAALYRPAQRAEQVGGDWYDAFAVTAGCTAVAIGDAPGHDIAAAAQMARLRTMTRTLALTADQPSPSMVLHRVEQIADQLGAPAVASAILAHLTTDADGYAVRWSNAGHLPPMFITADGVVHAPADNDIILGMAEHWTRRDHHHWLHRGDTLLLYTDGLVETRHAVIDEGVAALAAFVSDHAALPPDQLLDAIITAIAAPDHDDDIALLAIRAV